MVAHAVPMRCTSRSRFRPRAASLFGLVPNSAILVTIAASITASTASAATTRTSCNASNGSTQSCMAGPRSVPIMLSTADGLSSVNRDLLIVMDAVLILVECLLLYAISARDPLTRVGLFDALQLVLVVAALAVDAVMLTAMVTRIAEFGTSPNKLAALGLNLLLLVHLVGTAWATIWFLRGKRPFASLEHWQTRYLPAYGAWAAIVVVAFGPIFGFA